LFNLTPLKKKKKKKKKKEEEEEEEEEEEGEDGFVDSYKLRMHKEPKVRWT
jgi:hypothetical protein